MAAAAAPRVPAAAALPAAALRPGLVRLATFALLGAFASSVWGTNLLAPSGAGRCVLMALIAAAAGVVMLGLAEVRNPVARHGGCALALLIATGFMFEAAGVGARLLVPDAWGDLASGIREGITALPGATVPYDGADPWVRTTILSGAGGLLLLAAGLAFWPRPARARAPRPTLAAVALGVLYGVPAVERNFAHPWLSGAILTLALTGFLWGERLERQQAWITAALALVALSTGLLLAPRIDGAHALLDPQHLADPLAAKGGDTFTWTHQYGPLTWPRDGREVLRVKAKTPTYWKAVNLVAFDGIRWRQEPVIGPNVADTEFAPGQPQWHQTITVVVRSLRSFEYVTAGTAQIISATHRLHVQDSPGTFVTGRTPLQPGDSYKARVYTPRPSEAQLASAGTRYPDSFTGDDLSMALPAAVGGPKATNPFTRTVSSRYSDEIVFRTFGQTAPPLAQKPDATTTADGDVLLRHSAYAREYALARRLAAESSSPYDFVQRVQREVRRNARYSESPPLTKIPLDTFLFKTRVGYCQQFSGAMALLLRMGGVPARVASGFAPGSYDHKRKEYVVRDLDAHSWVEAYFPVYGWVPFDPTPSVAPARSRAGDDAASAATGDIRNKGGLGDRGSDPHAAGRGAGGGANAFKLPLIVLGVLLLSLTIVQVERRSRVGPPPAPIDPDLAELVRALRRSGRMPANDVTLARLENVLGGSDAAQGYLRAVREHRYAAPDGPAPTRQQRSELRRVLGAGLGPLGRIRGWWALPPRVLNSKTWPTSTSSFATGRAFWSRATSMLQRSR